MKLMVGQLRPSKGEVKVLGERAFGNRPLMRRIGYCPEHEGTYEDLTGLELVTALNRLHGIAPAEAKKRAEDMLVKLDLADAMHRRLGEYSKGMRQRAKLAQAMAHDPEVIFLDEPTTGLHIDDVRVLIGVLDKLVDAGHTVVVIEHHMDVVKRADWVIDMGPEAGPNGGEIVAMGRPEDVARVERSHTARYLRAALAET